MALQEQTGAGVAGGIRGFRLHDNQHGHRQDVHRKETVKIQNHAIQNAHAEKRKKSTQKNSRCCRK